MNLFYNNTLLHDWTVKRLNPMHAKLEPLIHRLLPLQIDGVNVGLWRIYIYRQFMGNIDHTSIWPSIHCPVCPFCKALDLMFRVLGMVSNRTWVLDTTSSFLLHQVLNLLLSPFQDILQLGIIACSLLGPELFHVPKEHIAEGGYQ